VKVNAALEHFDPAKPLDTYELQDLLFGRPDPEAVYYPDKILVFGDTPTRPLGCLCLDTMEEFCV